MRNKTPTQPINLYPKVYLYRRIVGAKLFIEAHYANNIDLRNMAGEACFSKYHFIRQFHSLYNKTPHQYLSFVRIEKAKQLLNGEMSVGDVCFAVGFESISSFTGLFKRMVGQTPASYKNRQQQKTIEILASPLNYVPNCFAEKKGWR